MKMITFFIYFILSHDKRTSISKVIKVIHRLPDRKQAGGRRGQIPTVHAQSYLAAFIYWFVWFVKTGRCSSCSVAVTSLNWLCPWLTVSACCQIVDVTFHKLSIPVTCWITRTDHQSFCYLCSFFQMTDQVANHVKRNRYTIYSISSFRRSNCILVLLYVWQANGRNVFSACATIRM